MGKAAQRRNENRRDYLVRLAFEDPRRFEFEWEKRLSSWVPMWIRDIRKEAESWEKGEGYEKRIFDILDEATEKVMEILNACPKGISKRLADRTLGLISNECCAEVAAIVDPRLYRLSKITAIAAKSRVVGVRRTVG
jgi:hypothetical protein